MTSVQRLRLGLLLLCLLILAGWAGVVAASGPAAGWTVIGAGGAPSTGATLSLNGTLGQTAIGPSQAAIAGLGAGFWYGLGRGMYSTYLPLVLRRS